MVLIFLIIKKFFSNLNFKPVDLEKEKFPMMIIFLIYLFKISYRAFLLSRKNISRGLPCFKPGGIIITLTPDGNIYTNLFMKITLIESFYKVSLKRHS
jgi:hypothetical protein